MTKQEYMKQLLEALYGFSEETIKEVKEDYENHFEMGLKNGKSEDEICKELGSIEEFIAELSLMEDAKKVPIVVKEKKDEKTDNNKTTEQDFHEGWTDDGRGREWGEGKANKVIVDGVVADIIIRRSNSDKVVIKYENNGSARSQMQYRFDFKQEGDTIYAMVRKSKTSAGLFWNVGSTNILLTVMLPEGLKKAEFKTLSGDIQAEGLVVKGLFMDTVSGDIKVKEVNAGKLSIHTVSGDLQLQQIATDNIQTETKSGEVTIEGARYQEGNINSISGDVTIRNANGKRGKFSTISGDIEIQEVRFPEIVVSSISGDVKVDGAFEDGKFSSTSGDVTLISQGDIKGTLNTVSGDIDIRLNNQNGGYEFKFHSISGEIAIDYNKERYHFSKNVQFQYGNRTSHLQINTISGSMRLRD